jgi:hypothetical protein
MRFAFGFSIPFGVVFGWGLLAEWTFMSYRPGNLAYFAGWAFALPVGTAWGVFEIVSLVRPRRAFDLRAPRHLSAIIYGFAAGLLTAGTALLALTWLESTAIDGRAADEVAIGAGAAIWTAIVLFILRPIRRSRCVSCGYDLSGIAGPRCPECGLVGASGRSA